jgi:hypothetical protein
MPTEQRRRKINHCYLVQEVIMARSPFTIIERKNTAGKRVFMVRFVTKEEKYNRSIALSDEKS